MKYGIAAKARRSWLAALIGVIEWRTVAVILGGHAIWLAAGLLYSIVGWASLMPLALSIAFHSSLQHEVIHRHPTPRAGWNEAMVFLPLGLLVPFRRYREMHLRHHRDSRLTDPYDDPESFYLAFHQYQRLPRPLRAVLDWNNMLVVRMLLGPMISAVGFVLAEVRGMAHPRDCSVDARLQAWGLHAIGLVAVAALVHFAFGMPAWAYLAAVYLALSLQAVRSFCEHRWAAATDDRTVIVERSWLSFLFLNNNLHLVHHKHPGLAWYSLPAAYHARRAEWQAMNSGYVFRSYGALMRAFGLRRKEPVAHPPTRAAAVRRPAVAAASPPTSR